VERRQADLFVSHASRPDELYLSAVKLRYGNDSTIAAK
jgi:hypothetical protein